VIPKPSPFDDLARGITCPACGKPYESPDFDPRCSSCAESGTEPIPDELRARKSNSPEA